MPEPVPAPASAPAPTPEQQRILDALIAHARPVILSEFSPDSCIASTRIGLDVLDYFGIPAQEYPLLVAVFNPDAVAMLQAGASPQAIAAATREHGPDDPEGAWTVGMGATPDSGGRPDGWSGHLVIGSPALGIVADLSADQASRPIKRMTVVPYWAPVANPDWFTDPTAREFLHNIDEQILLILDRAAIDPLGYRQSANWQRRSAGASPGLYKRLTGQIIRAMRDDLAG